MLRIIIMACCTALLVAGCGSDPTPVEPSPSPTATSTLEPPVMPEQAREDSAEGAANFAGHYIAVLNYAAGSGDVKRLTALSHEDCEGCTSYIDLYRSTYESGGYFNGTAWTPSNFEVRQIGEVFTVFFRVEAPVGQYRSSGDADEMPTSGEDTEMVLEIERNDTQWIVTAFARRAP